MENNNLENKNEVVEAQKEETKKFNFFSPTIITIFVGVLAIILGIVVMVVLTVTGS